MAAHCLLRTLVVSYFLLLVLAQEDVHCPQQSPCGHLGPIHFPFTISTNPKCGLQVSNCEDEQADKQVLLGDQWYLIESIEQKQDYYNSMLVKSHELQSLLSSRKCSVFNYTFPVATPLMSFHIENNITLFRCNRTLHVSSPQQFAKYKDTDCDKYDIFYGPESFGPPSDKTRSSFNKCSRIHLPITPQPNHHKPSAFNLTAEFHIQVIVSRECRECNEKGGLCRLSDRENLACAYPKEENPRVARGTIIGASAAGLGLLIVLACFFTKKVVSTNSLIFWKKENLTHQIIETALEEHGQIRPIRYSYSEVKKITNSFKNKLGQGGYGSVYKGKLKDGRLVAVKVLSESKGNGEEFINEIASISRTSHVNVVVLLGFCFQGSKRALIYEYMPNGSLERFIYEENALTANRQLDCKTLYDIAIGVGRGLEYLHRGCNRTRILHLDIKPHNILLDENFCPKISDFGLAKICQRTESIISILGARGTIGYIAPEVFSRNFGEVSHKSDVYSYGMMFLEMIGGRKNNNLNVEYSSEIYFPHWIYKRIELNQELVLRCIKNDNDKEIVKKMTMVSLWCIQTDPSTRPTMNEVVKMLEGSLESLQVPPRPCLYSPSTSPIHSST